MSAETAAMWSGILSGAICGGSAIVGAIWAVRKGLRELEETEIRRQRVECITSMYGLRFVLSDPSAGFSPRPEDVARFMFEFNRAGALFAKDGEVLNGLRDFYESVRTKTGDPTSQLIALIKNMARNTRLEIGTLSDTDVKNIFTLPNTNLIVQFVPVAVAPGGVPAPQQNPPVLPQTSRVSGIPGTTRA
jgi:hypothetical protein